MRVGVDLGGTKIEAVALDDDGRELSRRRVATPAGDYAKTIAVIAALVVELEVEVGPARGVGVGHPGSRSPTTGLIRNANSTVLNGRRLDLDLARALGREIALANDADCFALSEAHDGAAAGCSVVFGVILGTGVGGGLVVDGRLIRGANGIAGEWGHNPLPRMSAAERPGPACWCGRLGCVETFLSGPGLSRDHAATSSAAERLDARAIVEAAAAGEPRARASLDRYVDRLARALAGVINLVDPDAIVLGGGLSNCAALYEAVPRRWAAEIFADRVGTELRPPKWGDSSGARGAASIATSSAAPSTAPATSRP